MKIPNTDEVRDHFLAAFADIFPEASDWDLTQAVNAVTGYTVVTTAPKAKGIPQVKDTARMGDEELRKYYAGRAAYDDVQFFLAHAMATITQRDAARWATLEKLTRESGGKYTPAIRKEYANLKGHYWTNKLAMERRGHFAEVAA